MKREIRCTECEPKPLDLKIVEIEGRSYIVDLYPGEHQKVVRGKSIRNKLLCDYCNKTISKGDDCLAISIWADYGGGPYYEWEGGYVE